MPISTAIVSPCLKICQVDRLLGICIGCERTLDEIGRWSSYSDHKRTQVMSELAARRTIRLGPAGERG